MNVHSLINLILFPICDVTISIMKKDGEFILAFARRNVSIDKVWNQAKDMNLGMIEVLDMEVGSGESIYSVKFLEV